MSQDVPDRLDRIEAMLERIVNIQVTQQESISKLVEGQLADQILRGQLTEHTMQLKRAVDYLLSKDRGQDELSIAGIAW
ncbi:hypothetical protein [Acaryochloris sp. IP29b_bin.137]|uniref:hypothetical protein n=1 Tax=Acaryochloris sp. IP29b_bin.137 TaxID=2969217 RepID=UPI00262AE7FA|nr:hypothetical protein [Acaryochloris sp. IP29b_bin.137]